MATGFAGRGHNKPPDDKKYRLPAYCRCHTCNRRIDSLGIAGHRAMHRRRRETCEITYSDGLTYIHDFAPKEPAP